MEEHARLAFNHDAGHRRTLFSALTFCLLSCDFVPSVWALCSWRSASARFETTPLSQIHLDQHFPLVRQAMSSRWCLRCPDPSAWSMPELCSRLLTLSHLRTRIGPSVPIPVAMSILCHYFHRRPASVTCMRPARTFLRCRELFFIVINETCLKKLSSKWERPRFDRGSDCRSLPHRCRTWAGLDLALASLHHSDSSWYPLHRLRLY
jgi:hypothetical protein